MGEIWNLSSEIKSFWGGILVMTIGALVAFLFRLYTRAFISTGLGLDDLSMIGATFAMIAHQVAVMYQIRWGVGNKALLRRLNEGYYSGTDFVAVDEELRDGLQAFQQNVLRNLYYAFLAYQVAHTLVNLSILFQYRRIFTTPQANKATLAILSYLVVHGVISLNVCVFTCWPVSLFWTRAGPDADTCMNRFVTSSMLGITNLLNDIMLVVFPVPFLVKLQVKLRVKFGLSLLFGCGIVASSASIHRIITLIQVDTMDWWDQLISRRVLRVSAVSVAEISILIVCGSVPSLKPLALAARARCCGRRRSATTANVYAPYNNLENANGGGPCPHQSSESISLEDFLRNGPPERTPGARGNPFTGPLDPPIGRIRPPIATLTPSASMTPSARARTYAIRIGNPARARSPSRSPPTSFEYPRSSHSTVMPPTTGVSDTAAVDNMWGPIPMKLEINVRRSVTVTEMFRDLSDVELESIGFGTTTDIKGGDWV